MDRPPTFGANRVIWPGVAGPFVLCLIGLALLASGCTQNQMKSLLGVEDDSDETTAESVAMPTPPAVPAPAPQAPQAPEAPSPASPPPAPAALPLAVDVKPGSGRYGKLAAGFRIKPPATFNVISLDEGSDFHENYVHYRWERLSGGAWFIVTVLSGLDYEGDRAPQLDDPQFVQRRIRVAFARVDEKHQLRSMGSRSEKLAGLKAIRTNVAGKAEGEDAVGHLYLIFDGKHLLEIVALATEPNRDVLKTCREAVATLANGG